jgi:hypothetical protein
MPVLLLAAQQALHQRALFACALDQLLGADAVVLDAALELADLAAMDLPFRQAVLLDVRLADHRGALDLRARLEMPLPLDMRMMRLRLRLEMPARQARRHLAVRLVLLMVLVLLVMLGAAMPAAMMVAVSRARGQGRNAGEQRAAGRGGDPAFTKRKSGGFAGILTGAVGHAGLGLLFRIFVMKIYPGPGNILLSVGNCQ